MLETLVTLVGIQILISIGIYFKIKPIPAPVVVQGPSGPSHVPSGRSCQLCYMEIHKKARRCPHCTSNLGAYGDV